MGTRLLHRYAEQAGITPADVHPWMVAALVETKDPRPKKAPKPKPKRPKKPFWFWGWVASKDPTPKPWWPWTGVPMPDEEPAGEQAADGDSLDDD